jgi:hypothetical protein
VHPETIKMGEQSISMETFSINIELIMNTAMPIILDRHIIQPFLKHLKSNASPSLSAVIWINTDTTLKGWHPLRTQSAHSLIPRTTKSKVMSSDFMQKTFRTLSLGSSISSTLRAPDICLMLLLLQSLSSTSQILSLSPSAVEVLSTVIQTLF